MQGSPKYDRADAIVVASGAKTPQRQAQARNFRVSR